MSDIDFDELDRAVNGAINGTPKENSVHTPVERTVISYVAPATDTPSTLPTPTPTQASAPTSVSDTIPVSVSTPTPTPVSSPVSAAPAARRSSGRFMDMVHPSSDMRSHGNEPVVTTRPEPTVASEPVITEEQEAAWNEPLESPFLPDAKVEKRPLGGSGAPVIPASPTPAATPIVNDFTETASFPDPIDFQNHIKEPEEELLEAPESQERIEATTMPDPIDFAAASAINDDIELSHVEVEEPVGPTSITPQYKEQQTSTSQESGAIFDTESYHQAVTKPLKKKAGWLVGVWIALLVLLGAAVGWAVYTYVLPML